MIDFPTLSMEEAANYLSLPFSQSQEGYEAFLQTILGFYEGHGRQFIWRETSDPYRILLSEVMLQQTQTSRVIPKYELFLSLWPTLKDLAGVALDELLYHWKGLGYNRRALNLRRSAIASREWDWNLPTKQTELLSLPGVGKATAAAIGAFSYRERTIYLETNIRRVLLHCFYPDQEGVKDKELELLLGRLVQLVEDPKAWYYALMDFGVLLKHLLPNANMRSAHYTKQAKFENSNRQIRGQLIHLLSDTGAKEQQQVTTLLSHFEEERVLYCLGQLEKEGFVEETEGTYRIAKA
ncbi:MAG: DNA repair protein [Sphaerochaeta sp.]|uniref:DNA repair protein n=1 Tax=Sphaerochaeta sp. TaxID=1972642 RepID=UPI003D112F93